MDPSFISTLIHTNLVHLPPPSYFFTYIHFRIILPLMPMPSKYFIQVSQPKLCIYFPYLPFGPHAPYISYILYMWKYAIRLEAKSLPGTFSSIFRHSQNLIYNSWHSNIEIWIIRLIIKYKALKELVQFQAVQKINVSFVKLIFFIVFNNFPTRCDLFILLHYYRQLYMFRVLTPIIRSSYNCKYSFRFWLNGSTTIRFRCWVGTTVTQLVEFQPNNDSRW